MTNSTFSLWNIARMSMLAAAFLLTMTFSAFAQVEEPPVEEPVEEPTQPETEYTAEANIVTALEEAGNFATLLDALRATGLDQTLQTEGPFTLFAPTDEAFDALPAGTLENLPQEELASLLAYHVVADEVTGEEVGTLDQIETASGSTIMVGEDGKTLNEANIVQADIKASNGVIHSIDTVLMPKDPSGPGSSGK